MSQASVLEEYEWGDSDWNVEAIIDAWASREVLDEGWVDDADLALYDAGVMDREELPSDAFKRVMLGVSSTPGHDTDGVPTHEGARVIRVSVEYITPLVDYDGTPIAKRVLSCDVYLN